MPADPAHQELLERLRLDQRQRWEKGESVRAEEYLADHATLRSDSDGALELIYNEVVLREESGHHPRLEEYTQRFPQLTERLRPLFEVHQAIEASGKPDPYATIPPTAGEPRRAPLAGGETCELGPAFASPKADPYATVVSDGTIQPSATGKSEAPAPDVITGYEILQILGEGGMGVVFKARHRALRRLVALKMIRPEVYAGTEERARFLTEAQAIARLQHPHIVQIYEVGEQDGRPFFAMEFVEGGSLDRRLNGTPMQPREAAQLVFLLSRAIEVAHQAGVIHRDLKPANILICDPRQMEKDPVPASKPDDSSTQSQVSRLWRRMGLGRQTTLKFKRKQTFHGKQTMIPGLGPIPKITDFGLAKNLDQDVGQTRAGTIMGTPSYMPPEQATGDAQAIGPLVDVYALGAILYETLTGRPPFRGATVLDTLDQVRKQDPVPPSRLQPNLPGDLETISLKCLEKDPKRRYDSARGLADDLERYLGGEPIVARPVSVLERGLKWARRRPAFAALIALGAVAVLCLTLFGWLWGVRESTHAEESQQREQSVQASFREALQAVDDMLREVGEVDLADEPHMEHVRKRLLAKAQTYFTRFLKGHGNDPVVRHEVARAHSRLGDIHNLLGEHADSEQAYLQALPFLEQLASESSVRTETRRELARARHGLGIVLKKLNRFQESEAAFRDALRVRDELSGNSQEPTDRRDLAFSRYWLGALLAPLTGRRQEAEEAYRAALKIQEPLAQAHRDQPGYRRELARTLNNLALLLKEVKHLETEATFRRALELQEELVRADSTKAEYKRDLARTRGNLGEWYASDRRVKQAIESYEASQSLLAELARDFPKVPDYQLEHSVVISNLAWQIRATKPREAEDAFLRALAIREKLVKDLPGVPEYRLRLGQHHNTMGRYFDLTARPEEAIRSYESGLDVQRRLVVEYPNVPDYHNALGCTYHNLAMLRLGHSELRERSQQAALGMAGFSGNPLALALVVYHARAGLSDAKRYLHEGIKELDLAVRANAQHAFFCKQLCDSYTVLSETALRLGDHVEAAAAAEMLARAPLSTVDDRLRAVRFLARCVSLAAQNAGTTPDLRDQAAAAYGDRAIAILNEVLGKSSLSPEATRRILDGPNGLKTHPGYAPLRGREEFRKLLEQVDSRAGTAVG